MGPKWPKLIGTVEDVLNSFIEDRVFEPSLSGSTFNFYFFKG